MERSKNSSLARCLLSSVFSLFVYICVLRYLGEFTVMRGGEAAQIQQKSEGD